MDPRAPGSDPFGPPRVLGRVPVPVEVEYVRDLTAADLADLGAARGSTYHPIAKLRDSHHAVARALALGERPVDVARMTGYTQATISRLQADPTFQGLLEHYRQVARGEAEESIADYGQRLALFKLDALSIAHERMLEQAEALAPALALDMALKAGDRLGFGPATKTTNVNVNVDLAGRLDRARERIAAVASLPSRDTPTLDLTASPLGPAEVGQTEEVG